MKLLIDKIRLALQKRLKLTQNQKTYAMWVAKGYINTPIVSFILQSHNKSLQIEHIVHKLRKYPKCEIIVIDDGSDKPHSIRLTKLLTRANEFLIRSNDLYENVMYDKTIRFANGKYIALLQDDDDFENLDWIDQAIHYFEQNPRLAILGGKNGLDIVFEEEKKHGHGGKYALQNASFSFVPAVNRAPMWINKTLFIEHLKHIDFSFAPFQFDDYELCARTWLSGLQVAWYNAYFKSLSVGGMRLWNSAFTTEQSTRNGHKLYELYHNRIEEIHELVDLSNKSLNKNQLIK